MLLWMLRNDQWFARTWNILHSARTPRQDVRGCRLGACEAHADEAALRTGAQALCMWSNGVARDPQQTAPRCTSPRPPKCHTPSRLPTFVAIYF